jgi:ribosomal protein S18 acetylase RimI-like enzyme
VAEPLVAAEARAWREELHWDVSRAWRVIEPARAAGRLAGFVLLDEADAIVGWTCFLAHRGVLQVMTLRAETVEATSRLVHAVVVSDEARECASISFFVRDAAPGLEIDLQTRGFAVAPYRYLFTPIARGDAVSMHERPLTPADRDRAARLLARAYSASTEIRAFAPGGTYEEWQEYVANLLGTPDCGTFLGEASFACPAGAGDELEGAVIATDLGSGTAHIAQLAVDPAARGRGLGAGLVGTSLRAAAVCGFQRATLLVSSANAAASAIYEAQGFRDCARFVMAARLQPRRSTSVAALATGGASTRR